MMMPSSRQLQSRIHRHPDRIVLTVIRKPPTAHALEVSRGPTGADERGEATCFPRRFVRGGCAALWWGSMRSGLYTGHGR